MSRKSLLLCFLPVLLFFSTANAQEDELCEFPVLSSQADIDNFSTNYPGCLSGESIAYSLTISGSDITNLDGLSGITWVGMRGGINITDNPQLNDISGLRNISGDIAAIHVMNNPLLETLEGLEGITQVFYLQVENNPVLKDLEGLSGIHMTTDELSISENASLTNLKGLDNLTTATGAVFIKNNQKLTSLSGLQSLETSGAFSITGNPLLTDLSALLSLETIYYSLEIGNNAKLGSLYGLDNIRWNIDFYILNIYECPLLTYCAVAGICDLFAYNDFKYGHDTDTDIRGNGAGCSTREELLASLTCRTALPVTFVNFEGKSTAEGNRLEWHTSSELNNAGFAIESSLNAMRFDQIGFVMGNGTANSVKKYSFTESMPADVTYYRLKQIDFDSTVAYSKVIVVKKSDAGVQAEDISVFPNPSNGQLFVKAQKSQEYSIQTLGGKLIRKGIVAAGKPIKTNDLQNGLYLVKVGQEVFKIVISN
ncbi:hypothetical protein DYBT9623_01120 [Dyadobacter sp. CECT 9623]|uniref:Secretion system C-terminal sorting domain-containing protein n=1 Tax=Dyadobacter linearis TaxID=2823330 RepID=A0ABM8ULZ0_9BACT|nr:T9SS type A sorting domain-containing protein [Dyadobacter sp. CECT 9623]CAG5068390.1 hypothetical protein DYBT9623_01120 [Dyadobacter sp. CECT 9623]